MLSLKEARDAVVRLVVDEDGAEESLLGLDVVGRDPKREGFGRASLACALSGPAACKFDHGPRGRRIRVRPAARFALKCARALAFSQFSTERSCDRPSTQGRALRFWQAPVTGIAGLIMARSSAFAQLGGKTGKLFARHAWALRAFVLDDAALGLEHVVAGNRQGAHALGELHLEHHEILMAEGRLRSGKVELPHPAEGLIADGCGLLPVGKEALAPGPEGLSVMQAQDLQVRDDEPGALD